jgi:hypothetical protein
MRRCIPNNPLNSAIITLPPIFKLEQDQHYCTVSLNKLLTSHPTVRGRWLRRVRTARALYVRDGKSQHVMTRYKPLLGIVLKISLGTQP